jgi:hypothetical protein
MCALTLTLHRMSVGYTALVVSVLSPPLIVCQFTTTITIMNARYRSWLMWSLCWLTAASSTHTVSYSLMSPNTFSNSSWVGTSLIVLLLLLLLLFLLLVLPVLRLCRCRWWHHCW